MFRALQQTSSGCVKNISLLIHEMTITESWCNMTQSAPLRLCDYLFLDRVGNCLVTRPEDVAAICMQLQHPVHYVHSSTSQPNMDYINVEFY